MKIPSKNQYLFLQKTKIGQMFMSSDIKKMFKKSKQKLGGLLSSFTRAGYIEPIYREKTGDVLWKRIK